MSDTDRGMRLSLAEKVGYGLGDTAAAAGTMLPASARRALAGSAVTSTSAPTRCRARCADRRLPDP